MIFTLSALLLGAMQTAQLSDVPHMVTVEVRAGPCRVLIEGKSATFKQLRSAARRWHRAQPAINFRPSPEARYECVARALRILWDEKAGRLGFLGNELEVAPR